MASAPAAGTAVDEPLSKSPFIRWILRTVGILCVGLGVLGIFVPLLPTTPFLLLAAACFVRSSPRLYAWLIQHPWFGKYILYYREYRAIPLRAKIFVLALLWAVIGYAAWRVATAWWLRGLLAAVALGVTIHLAQLRTLTQEMIDQVEGPAKTQPVKAAGSSSDR
jgi:uncharacterized membrane protein YbaN (DUF454 family)